MKRLIKVLIKQLDRQNAGLICGGLCFCIGLMFAIFGFWKTFFIFLFAILGYIFGAKILSDRERLRRVIDKLLPPGRFR